MEFVTLRVDLIEGKVLLRRERLEGVYGLLDYGLNVHNFFKTYEKEPYSPYNAVVFGKGPFAGSILPGSHRLVFFFKSPLYRTLFPSTMGGAAYTFQRTGVDFVSIIGKAETPSVLVIYGDETSVVVSVEPLKKSLSELWKDGVYSFSDYLVGKFLDRVPGELRIACVGPASLNTNYGAIFSQTLRNGKPVEGSEDWAARGGGGSVLLRAHNIAAIVFGGVYKEEKRLISNYDHTKKLFSGIFSEPLFKVIAKKTEKYRYNPKHGTGGTFGEDYYAEREKTPILNWQMPYIPREDRERLFNLIKEKYVEIFNKESIDKNTWTTCGEPCPAACKKVRNGLKVDYEPYNANGPLAGNIYLKAADRAVRTVDSLGFDAIEFGCIASWVFELIEREILTPEEVGISGKPLLSPQTLINEPEKASEVNADLLCQLAKNVAYAKGEFPKLLGEGKRKAASYIDENFKERIPEGRSSLDYAVFVALGKEGEICPTMYWALGNFIPLPVQGKYWTYYKFGVFPEPESLAEKIVESSISEYWYDNVGWCRFHRRWMTAGEVSCELDGECSLSRGLAKPVLERLFEVVYGEGVNLLRHGKDFLKRLCDYALKSGSYPIFPPSERVIDLIAGASYEFGNKRWEENFRKNKAKAVRDYISKTLETYSLLIGHEGWKL
ncbi:glyceraldehyde-3-phosphate ferredoxin oxidoreductase [Thermovibrio guaymasensis]|uniref:Glyceraldehyde-3-phosphate ferredoxin oxidoreductase n=1 Tax=Thermovibrio guaymasensis TaxID=240167 RepID=A0A420W923_9BACT|nr:aldehyde ferredoxin oxidoreductase N-terminal domain-containing protein [Thermovibrio guaymasensis]RKQ63807.1 glyceraldehyde-3-phosphate ferredoxin oxidoreductase [Thermovibrio guaymasensis]